MVNIDGLLRSLDEISIEKMNFFGKVVLLRVDMNSPVEKGEIKSIKKILVHIPTIKHLRDMGAMTVLVTHQGRLGDSDFISTEKIATILSKEIGSSVKFLPDKKIASIKTAIRRMQKGEIVMLENIRMFDGETKKVSALEHSSSGFIMELSKTSFAYVNDAFSSLHRKHASIVGPVILLPSFIGLHMQKELDAARKLQEEASKPTLFMIGGKKVEDSIDYINGLFESGAAQKIVLTGLVGQAFLIAKGNDIGSDTLKLRVEYAAQISEISKILSKYSSRLILPIDVAVEENGKRVEYDVGSIPKVGAAFDIGTKTIGRIKETLRNFNSVVLRGPLGMIENENFQKGTLEVMNMLVAEQKYTVLAGGHTQKLVESDKIKGKLNGYASTGGGAMLSLLAGNTLPALDTLIANSHKAKLLIDPKKAEELKQITRRGGARTKITR